MATEACIMARSYFIVDFKIDTFSRGFLAKNFTCIPLTFWHQNLGFKF
jgi:hypothetical protein